MNCRTALTCAALITLAACIHVPSVPSGPAEYWGFTGPWDKRSDQSVEQHGASLGRVITGWITFDTTSFLPVQVYRDTVRTDPSQRMALITSYSGNRFHPEVIRPHVRSFKLPERVESLKPRLQHWADLIASGRADDFKETDLLPDFLTDIFCNLLGYTRPVGPADTFTLSRETHVEVDGQFA